MVVFLRDIKIKGVKNLKDEVVLTFANKEINDFKKVKSNNIKAIYGPNGSGKTAIVYSFEILRNLLTNPHYLQDSQKVKELNTLLNKESNAIELSLNFFVKSTDKTMFIYQYATVLMSIEM